MSKLHRIKEAAIEDPIERVYPYPDALWDGLVIELKSGTKLYAEPPKPWLKELGIVVAYGAAEAPGVPTVSLEPVNVDSNLTDRPDIVEAVLRWEESFEQPPDARRQA